MTLYFSAADLSLCSHVKPVPWSFEGSVAQGLEEQPIDPVIERLRQDLPVSVEIMTIRCI